VSDERHGLVIGKFRPPHRGHDLLIRTAREQVDRLTAIVCADRSDPIPAERRAAWLREIHPDVEVRVEETTGYDPDDSRLWADLTRRWLGRAPDVVFTSESYGEPYARFLGCAHVAVDPSRRRVPVSGSAVLARPLAHLDYLEPCVRAYFVPRVVLVGAESTGKTTLARALAEHYRTAWVPEYARLYCDGLLASRDYVWHPRDFVHLARAQQGLEDELARHAIPVLICDTDAFATALWHELYLGHPSEEVRRIADSRGYALYLLAGDEIPWEDDGTRDRPHRRSWFQRRFHDGLIASGRPFVEVTGSLEVRIERSIVEIDRLLKELGWNEARIIGLEPGGG
jgi:NadR type nicotinamide-nucleotide adenylyltransferase